MSHAFQMVFFAIFMMWAYTPAEYTRKLGSPPTSVWRPLWDSSVFSPLKQSAISCILFTCYRINYSKLSYRNAPILPIHATSLLGDFAQEIYGSLRFFVDYMRGKPYARTPRENGQANMDFGEAFGVSMNRTVPYVVKQEQSSYGRVEGDGASHRGDIAPEGVAVRPSFDEHIHLAPYPGSATEQR